MYIYIYIHIHTYIHIHIHIHIHILLVLSVYVVSLLASYLTFIALCQPCSPPLSPSPHLPSPPIQHYKAYLQPSWTLSAKKIKVLLYFSRTPFQFFFLIFRQSWTKIVAKKKNLIFYAVFLLPFPLHQF